MRLDAPTDFFGRQDRARKRTGRLILLFAAGVWGIASCLYVVVYFVWHVFIANSPHDRIMALDLGVGWDPVMYAATAVSTLLVILTGSLSELYQLRRWGGAGLAQRMGGRLIAPNTRVQAEKRLLNVVDEMALAAGAPVPQIYVLHDEPSINAFSAGFSPSEAVMGFTRGAVQHLDRDELQAVVAHEFSHVLNGDMRMNLQLMGAVQGMLMIGAAGTGLLAMAGVVDDDESHAAMASGSGLVRFAWAGFLVAGLGLVAVGYIGVIFSRLVKSAVARQREVLADAAALQFTRNPAGLAGALKKVGGYGRFTRLLSNYVEQTDHLFFSSPMQQTRLGRYRATHPPLADRIRLIDPSFDGTYPRIERKHSAYMKDLLEGRVRKRPEKPPDKNPSAVMASIGTPLRVHVQRAQSLVMASIGTPLRVHVQRAQSLLDALPEALREAVHDPYGARAVLYALLLDEDAAILARQWQALEEQGDAGVLEETRRLEGAVRQADKEVRMALVDLAVPTLKALSADQYRVCRRHIDALVEADEEIDLFEFTLLHTLRQKLDAYFEKPGIRIAQIYSVWGMQRECSVLLSLLARLDMAGVAQTKEAFKRAVKRLDEPRAAKIRLLSENVCTRLPRK